MFSGVQYFIVIKGKLDSMCSVECSILQSVRANWTVCVQWSAVLYSH